MDQQKTLWQTIANLDPQNRERRLDYMRRVCFHIVTRSAPPIKIEDANHGRIRFITAGV